MKAKRVGKGLWYVRFGQRAGMVTGGRVVVRRMAHYRVRLLVGFLDGAWFQGVLERIASLRERVRAWLPRVVGFQIKIGGFEVAAIAGDVRW